jgi:hypothetical protein
MATKVFLSKVISGGQTGVDRAALDAALALGLPCGGWCPRGRRAEDGRIADRYPMRECARSDYLTRTRLNVVNADATLILFERELSGGTATTRRLAEEADKRLLCVDMASPPEADPKERREAWVAAVLSWLWSAPRLPITLNVAGPRESTHRGIYGRARSILDFVLTQVQ